MRLRTALARLIIQVGSFTQSTALMVMRPDDLIEYSRQTYAGESKVAAWSSPDLVDVGLYANEKELLENLPLKQGQLLLLGVGGGREAIPLAEIGFQVTGVDFIPEMVDQAKQNAYRSGLAIEGLVQEISRLDVTDGAYDVVWLSTAMYSCVPTRKKRIEMLERICNALQPNGFLVCQFHWGANSHYSSKSKTEKLRKALAWLTLGNISYEPGDMLWYNIEFIHSFTSLEELRTEFTAAGFEISQLNISNNKIWGGAVLKKDIKRGFE